MLEASPESEKWLIKKKPLHCKRTKEHTVSTATGKFVALVAGVKTVSVWMLSVFMWKARSFTETE